MPETCDGFMVTRSVYVGLVAEVLKLFVPYPRNLPLPINSLYVHTKGAIAGFNLSLPAHALHIAKGFNAGEVRSFDLDPDTIPACWVGGGPSPQARLAFEFLSISSNMRTAFAICFTLSRIRSTACIVSQPHNFILSGDEKYVF